MEKNLPNYATMFKDTWVDWKTIMKYKDVITNKSG